MSSRDQGISIERQYGESGPAPLQASVPISQVEALVPRAMTSTADQDQDPGGDEEDAHDLQAGTAFLEDEDAGSEGE